jgi:hypothetical protein
VQAAWNNVFQVCCNSCRSSTSTYYTPPVVAYSAPVVAYSAPACCPQTTYQQRCCYEPVTTYQTTTYYEPVTSYRTSYYYEPVTTYRYTSYYDPCTGCCQQVATPCTSFRLRSQCNAVVSYVQRTALKPVTTYRQSCYLQPVTSCAAPPACPTCTPPAVAAAPATVPPPAAAESTSPPPAATENRQPPAAVGEERIPPTNGLSRPGSAQQQRLTPVPASPVRPVRVDRIASNPGAARIQGQLVRDDRVTPRAGGQLVFVSGGERPIQQNVSVDSTGFFAVSLPAGEWHLYERSTEGKAVYHSALQVRNHEDRQVMVVSR